MNRKPVNRETSVSYSVKQPCLLLPFLIEQIRGKSRNSVKSLLSRGQVAVDGQPVTRFDHPLTPGQTVTVLRRAAGAAVLPFEILFEDEELIAVNKPVGLLSVATDREKTATAYHILTDYVRAAWPDLRIYIIHRLDRDTSGVLLFAKTPQVKLAFQEDWNALVRKREYFAVVEGVPQKKSGTIRSRLYETSTHFVYSGSTRGRGQEAVTHYTLVAENGTFSLLRVEIDTGRKNQIRVHLKELGHPVAGDKKYGGTTDPLKRLCLHASSLVLTHPLTGEELTFHAEMPREFQKLFARK